MFAELHNPLAAFLARLNRASQPDQLDCLANEVMETGGTYTTPGDANGAASHLFEISLHGVAAFGRDEQDALRNWMRAAQALQQWNAPAPFTNPRNHAEEIANARAAMGCKL